MARHWDIDAAFRQGILRKEVQRFYASPQHCVEVVHTIQERNGRQMHVAITKGLASFIGVKDHPELRLENVQPDIAGYILRMIAAFFRLQKIALREGDIVRMAGVEHTLIYQEGTYLLSWQQGTET